MRAHEQADEHGIRQRYAVQLLCRKRIAESRDGHDVDTVPPLELDHRVRVRQAVARFQLLRRAAQRAAELERHEAVAVQDGADVRAVGLERRPNRPPDLSMRLDAPADKSGTRRKDEVPRHPLPDEVKIVVVAPHVLAGPGDLVALALRVVDGGSRTCAPDVVMRVEDAELLRCRSSGESQHGKQSEVSHPSHTSTCIGQLCKYSGETLT